MKTYDITIMGLTKAQAWSMIQRVPTGRPFKFEAKDDDPAPKANGKKRGTPYATDEDILSLTGKTAQKGSMRESVLVTFEKLEKKHGIGSVNRKMLRDACEKKQQDTQILYQLIRDGYLKKL